MQQPQKRCRGAHTQEMIRKKSLEKDSTEKENMNLFGCKSSCDAFMHSYQYEESKEHGEKGF